MTYTEFTKKLSSMRTMDFPSSFFRTNLMPLDASSVFTSYKQLEDYCNSDSSNGYPGQAVAVVTEDSTDFYVIAYSSTAPKNLTPVKLQVDLSGDNVSISIDGTTIKITGFDDAAPNSFPCKEGEGEDAKIVWKSVSDLISTPLNELKEKVDNEIGNRITDIEKALGTEGAEEEDGTGLRGQLKATYRELKAAYDELKNSIDIALGTNTDEESTEEGIYGSIKALQEGLQTESEAREESDNKLDERVTALEEDRTNREENLYPQLQQRLLAVETALKDTADSLISVVKLKNAIGDDTSGIIKKLNDLEDSLGGATDVSNRLSELEEYINDTLKSELLKLTAMDTHMKQEGIHLTEDDIVKIIKRCKVTLDGNVSST